MLRISLFAINCLFMSNKAQEIVKVKNTRVACDGAGSIRGGDRFNPSSLGHPKIYLEIDDRGYVDCGYCDRRFILTANS